MSASPRPGRYAGRLVAVLALGGLAGCAALAPAPPASAPPPRAVARPAPSAPQAGPATSLVPAVVDTLPSAEAIAVLGTIPEPLSAAERVPPPASAPDVSNTTLEVAPPDSLAAAPGGSAADSGTAEVPVPAPTVPLGGRPEGFASAGLPDSLLHPTAPVSSPGAAPPSATSASPSPPDHCWRVQLAAPAARAKAESRMAAAQSLLLVPVVTERAHGLYKVRTRGCLDKSAAEHLRDRARASGFAGAFCFEEAKP